MKGKLYKVRVSAIYQGPGYDVGKTDEVHVVASCAAEAARINPENVEDKPKEYEVISVEKVDDFVIDRT